MSLPSDRRQSGFTLIELIVTVTVLTILLAAAVPSFVEFFEKSRLRGAADDIATFMASARGGAVKMDRDVAVAFSGSTEAWCMGARAAANPLPAQPVPAATACDCEDAPAECVVDGRVLAVDGSRFEGVTLGATPAAYTVNGKLGTLAPLATQNLTLNSASGRFALVVRFSPLGQSNICIPAGSPVFGGYGAC